MGILFDLAPRPSLAESFVVEEQLAALGPCELRLWTHGPAIVAGSRDGRLPGFEQASRAFSALGYEVHLRSSGGGLVVLDPGVLNVSIAWHQELVPTIEEAYAIMHQVLRLACAQSAGPELVTGEVAGSLCPGRSDLAICGRKVAGISQSRRRQFVLVHAFVLVGGVAADRISLGQEFYRLAGCPADAVTSGTMCTLSEAFGHPVHVSSFADQVAAAGAALIEGLSP
ncbi:MAG: lipoate--protein ligase family protein [Sulfobacillus sp.]